LERVFKWSYKAANSLYSALRLIHLRSERIGALRVDWRGRSQRCVVALPEQRQGRDLFGELRLQRFNSRPVLRVLMGCRLQCRAPFVEIKQNGQPWFEAARPT
jgi:hypothetical protein